MSSNPKKVEEFIDEFRENEDAGICPHCGEHYRTLKFHIMRMHQKDKPFKCKECDNSYINKSELDMHFKYRHSKDVDIKICHLCGYETKYKEALKVHIKTTHENITRFSCTECDKKFYAKSHLKRHIKAAHRKSIECIKCVTCGLELKTESALLKHKNKVHRGMKFVCDICNAGFVSKEIMERHNAAVHEEKNCQISKVEFSKEKSLESHQKRVHEEISGRGHYENVPKKKKLLFICKICNGEFTSGETLKNHIRDIHEKANSFETQDLIADKNAEFLRSLDML